MTIATTYSTIALIGTIMKLIKTKNGKMEKRRRQMLEKSYEE